MAKDNHKTGLVDFWTPSHVLVGVLARYFGLSWQATLTIAGVFEVAENAFARTNTAKSITELSAPENMTNAVADIGFNMTGWYVTDKIMRRWGA